MNKNKILLLLAALLGGCATADLVGPWGYDVRLTRIEDARPDDDRKLMAAEPFQPSKLIEAWGRVMARSAWGAVPAQAALRVREFETTHSATSYAMSLKGDIVVSTPAKQPHYRETARQLLARREVSCMTYATSSGGKGGAALAAQVFGSASAPQGEGPHGLRALTTGQRDATLWTSLWNDCARQIARQLEEQLLSPS